MLEVIRQLAMDVAERGADFSIGTVTAVRPLRIRLEEGMELGEEFLVLSENVQDWEETGTVSINGGDWNGYRMKRNNALRDHEEVVLLRAADGQQYLVLGRARKEG